MEPTPTEKIFFTALAEQAPDIHDWYHQDNDGTPWMIASLDFVTDGTIVATLRLDYDGRNLRGGWSPACLNWDDGVRASEAGIDTTGPGGLHLDDVAPNAAAHSAAEWFAWHRSARAA